MDYTEKFKSEIEEFLEICHRLSKLMFVTSHGGNLAWKLGDGLILITPTKMNKSDIEKNDLVFIDSSGKKLWGERTQTGETPMYINFFRERQDICSVIHCHPPYTCAFAISSEKNWLMQPVFPETVIEVGPVPLVPYAEPLTQELADNFLPYIKKYNAFLMENHGLVLMSRDSIKRTMQLVEILEVTSKSLIHALNIGQIKKISKQALSDLNNTMKTRDIPLPGAPGVNGSLLDLYFSKEKEIIC